MTDAELNALCLAHAAWMKREIRSMDRWFRLMMVGIVAVIVATLTIPRWWLLAIPPVWFAHWRYERAYRRVHGASVTHSGVLQAELDRRCAALGMDQP
jgi:hypothetical protein